MKHTKSEQEILKKYRNFLYERLSEAHDYGGMIAASEDFLIQSIREEREKCKRIYIENVDWAEWGISDEEAGEYFDEEYEEMQK